MTKRTRRNHSGGFKATIALAALRGDKMLAEIAQHDEVHLNQVTEWKQQLLKRAAEVFDDGSSSVNTDNDPDIKTLHAKIGQLALENDFFKRRAHQGGIAERKDMIDRAHNLPMKWQCQILSLARSTAYYQPRGTGKADLALMRRMDELRLD